MGRAVVRSRTGSHQLRRDIEWLIVGRVAGSGSIPALSIRRHGIEFKNCSRGRWAPGWMLGFFSLSDVVLFACRLFLARSPAPGRIASAHSLHRNRDGGLIESSVPLIIRHGDVVDAVIVVVANY